MDTRRRVLAAAVLCLLATSCAEGQGLSEVATSVTDIDQTTSTAAIIITTTLTIPPGAASYASWAAGIGEEAQVFAARSSEINGDWEDRSKTYGETLESLRALLDDIESLSEEAEARRSPSDLTRHSSRLTTSLRSMAAEAEAMIVGLGSDDDGTIRRTAHTQLLVATDELAVAVARIHNEVGVAPPVATSTTTATTTPTTLTTTSTTTTTTTIVTTTTTRPNCHPSYTGACVPMGVSDVDCAGGSGNGPYYVGRVTVVGSDVYDLDRDNDGIGCE